MQISKIIKILQISAITVLLGRAWQHLYWDAPFRTVLWDENWMSGIVLFFGTEWQDYITNPETDIWIQRLIQFHGLIYLTGAISVFFLYKLPKYISKWTMILCSFLLFLLAGMYAKEKFYSLGQLLEYALQFSSPILLWVFYNQSINREQWYRIASWATALTFTCHGLYAINYYPRPGNFVDMVLNILPIGEEQAFLFLNIAGVLDFAIAIGLIFSTKKWHKPFLIYAIFWGVLTTLARLFAYIDFNAFNTSFAQWFHESLMRSPHFLIPLALYFLWSKTYSIKGKSER